LIIPSPWGCCANELEIRELVISVFRVEAVWKTSGKIVSELTWQQIDFERNLRPTGRQYTGEFSGQQATRFMESQMMLRLF
jgi:hypothetical protein